jgi:hypothetical protein
MSNIDCRRTGYGNRITDNMMCAGYSYGMKDSCQVNERITRYLQADEFNYSFREIVGDLCMLLMVQPICSWVSARSSIQSKLKSHPGNYTTKLTHQEYFIIIKKIIELRTIR